MYEHLITPSRTYYALPIAVFILGMAIFGIFLVGSLNGLGNDLPQYVVPGSHKIELTETGTYTVFYEYKSVVGDEIYSSPPNLPGLRVHLVSPVGDKVPLHPPSANGTYSLGGRSGFAALELEVQRPGLYQLSAGYESGVQEPRVVLAIGYDFMSTLFRTIIISFVIAFLSFAIAVTITIAIWRKRRKAKELLKLRFPNIPSQGT